MPRYLFLISLCVLLARCTAPDEPAATDEPSDAAVTVADAEYVGRDACQSCHPDQHASYEASQMGRSFKPATLERSVADFDDPEPIYDRKSNLYYQPFNRGEELFVKAYRLEEGDTTYTRVEKIDFIVGSGQHTNSHMRMENGYLYQIPVTWYAQKGMWELAPGFERGYNPGFDREIEGECMSCHNGIADFVPQSLNRFHSLPDGIGCERCHGPGSLHIRQMQYGDVAESPADTNRFIVNPAELSPERELDVCQRCHMQGAAVLKEGHGWYDFIPGQALEEVMSVFWPRRADSVQTFIMASHPDRLRMSACFESTWAPESPFEPMTCTTCHDPHVGIDTVPAEKFRSDCQSCHAAEEPELADAAPECTAPMPEREAVGDDCASCHMPTSGSSDIPHVQITDHYIRVPERDRTPQGDVEEVLRLANLTENDPSLETRALAFLTVQEEFEGPEALLDSAEVLLDEALQTQPVDSLMPALVRLRFLQHDYAAVRTLAAQAGTGVSDPWTLYRIGESFARVQDRVSTLEYYRRAVREAPDQLKFRMKLASTLADDGQLQEALREYDHLLEANPTMGMAFNNRGLIHAMLGNLQQAETDFRRALAFLPDLEQALGNIASLYFNTGRREEARPYVEHLVDLNPENAQYRQFLEMLDAGG